MQRSIFFFPFLSLSLSTEKNADIFRKKKSNDVVFKGVSIWGAFEMVPALKVH